MNRKFPTNFENTISSNWNTFKDSKKVLFTKNAISQIHIFRFSATSLGSNVTYFQVIIATLLHMSNFLLKTQVWVVPKFEFFTVNGLFYYYTYGENISWLRNALDFDGKKAHICRKTIFLNGKNNLHLFEMHLEDWNLEFVMFYYNKHLDRNLAKFMSGLHFFARNSSHTNFRLYTNSIWWIIF